MSVEIRRIAKSSLQENVSAEEWNTRVNLAACYRLAAHFRMTDLIYTHISARVPGPEHHALQSASDRMESAAAHAGQDRRIVQDLKLRRPTWN
jgi:hypothetical protein